MTPREGIAFVTPSYAADLQRCRLLCESMDAMADGPYRHYILVADHDLALFRPLDGPRRVVIPDSDLLPAWMRPVRRPFDRRGRHLWISTDLRRQIRPLSGWHVQQIRKLLAARIVDEMLIVMADSDSLFVRPFGAAQFIRDGRVRLYRRGGVILSGGAAPTSERHWVKHAAWTRLAAKTLGLPPPEFPADDFINNLVSWRKDVAMAAVGRVEETTGVCLPVALGRVRTMSEYQIYGAYAAGPGGMAGHFDSPDALSHTYWAGEALTPSRLDEFMTSLKPHQIALCIQSFTETPVELLRSLFSARTLAAARM